MGDVARTELRPAGGGRDGPELAVILATDGLEPARDTIGHLREQTARDRVELVLVTPPGSVDGDAGGDLDGFHSVSVVEWDTPGSAAAARAAGVSAARAPVVAMAETHCFPDPGWADALIAAHRGPWAAVGPEIANENPDRMSSWANLYVDYAAWVAPTRGPADDLPGHNSSYKRALLLEYGGELGRLLESESIMHWDLRSRGHRLFVEPEARVRHRNITKTRDALVEHFYNGRCFGGLRSRHWPVARRALYAAASPLIPAIRLARIIRRLRRTGRGNILPGALPMIVACLVVHAAGELTGYATGSGDAARRMAPYELHRNRYVAGAG
jgi:hypothetical protein